MTTQPRTSAGRGAVGKRGRVCCSTRHRHVHAATLQPSHTGYDVSQQLNPSCPSHLSGATKLLLPAGPAWAGQQQHVARPAVPWGWVHGHGSESSGMSGWETLMLLQQLSPTAGTTRCWCPRHGHVPLVPMGVGQSCGTGGRTRV